MNGAFDVSSFGFFVFCSPHLCFLCFCSGVIELLSSEKTRGMELKLRGNIPLKRGQIQGKEEHHPGEEVKVEALGMISYLG